MVKKPPRVDVKKITPRPSEEFDPGKLHQSIVATCLSVRCPEGQAEQIAHTVTLGVMNWCQTRSEITSGDIRRRAHHILKGSHPDAAYLYEHYKTII